MTSEIKKEDFPVPLPGAPCWIEIMSEDPHKLKEFYAALFPAWKFRAGEAGREDMVHVEFEQPSGLTGGILKRPKDCPKPSEQPMGIGSTVYYYVDSIDEIEKSIEKLGGVKVLNKTKESEHGWYANFKDPEGNRFGTYEANWAKN
ncbi:hypothetical protein BKA66DRAFT_467688 [Pyrenochaeta sp. MPI-SDFR-AT-0127]|nr:hypothetical protein BKA66DRAFT_467688 [Pyrenochaeta sp. MPI-SDFR-AT-0127]